MASSFKRFARGPVGAACLLALASTAATAAGAPARSYIVQLSDPPAATYTGGVAGLAATQVAEGQRLRVNAPQVKAYVAHLDQKQKAVMSKLSGQSKVLHRYHYTFNGFAAKMSEAQARKLARTPGVVRVTLDTPREVVTNHTPHFLGLDIPGGVWSQTRRGSLIKGEDVVIGMVDTGFQPENSSFYDQVDANGKPVHSGGTVAYGPPPAGWTGTCVAGPGFDPEKHCNNKVIGARAFDESFKATDPMIAWYEFLDSPRDSAGHGSHTASTAGGNWGADAPVAPGVNAGPISGMAPRARLAIYKVCWSYLNGPSYANSCWEGDSVAAIDQAVADGVDIISFSISGTQSDMNDPVELAYLNATAAGVFVAAAAGNDGPGQMVNHPSPWLTTVAASTHDRFFTADATLGNGNAYHGASHSTGLPSTQLILSSEAVAKGKGTEDGRLCKIGGLNPDKVAGKVVVCDRGINARVEKSQVVKDAGGVGMILVNTPANLPGGGATNLVDDYHSVPTVHVAVENRDAINAYATGAGGSAMLGVAAQEPGVIAPVMAEFSSRGPNMATPSVMKPDISAPGVSVVAAFTATQLDHAYHDGIVDGSIVPPETASLLDGTSMATPHISGIAALLKQGRPNRSPGAIKSALMLSAGPIYMADGTIDTRYVGYGAGHVNPNGAIDSTLLFPMDPTDYKRYLCGEGWWSNSSADCKASGSIDASNLNLASFSADVPATITFHRTVRNPSSSQFTYSSSIAVDGFTATVNPPSLTLPAGKKGEFEVTLTANGAALGEWKQGQLVWTDGTRQMRSPIMARMVNMTGPSNLSSAQTRDKLSATYRFGYSGDLSYQVGGLIPATRSDGNVVKSPDRDGDHACQTNAVGTAKFTFNAPAGTMALRFATFDSETSGKGTDDLDMFVYDSNGVLVGSSAGSSAEESVQLMSPTPGDYTACIHGFAPGDGVSTDFTLSSWVVAPNVGSPMMKATGIPTHVEPGDTAKVALSFKGAQSGVRYMAGVRMVQGADANTGPTLGVTLVSVESGLTKGVRGLTSARKSALLRSK